ncbi:hypothetical protein Q7P36_007375 [Cladosporium allicinum]
MQVDNIFDERRKTLVHIAQIVLIFLAIVLSISRVTIKNPPASRANTVAITLGIKSLIVIAYQLLTEHTLRFRKWASTKANAILNCLEVVFWLAVLVVTGGTVGSASGAAAALSALVLVIAIVLEVLSLWMAVVSVKQHRRDRHLPK